VQAHGVVTLDPGIDRTPRLAEAAEALVVHQLALQGREERLGHRVVVAGSHPASRLAHPEGGEQAPYLPGEVLAGAVGVENCTSKATPSAQRRLDGLDDQVIGHPVRECEAHDPARANIGDRGEVAKASLVRTNVLSLTERRAGFPGAKSWPTRSGSGTSSSRLVVRTKRRGVVAQIPSSAMSRSMRLWLTQKPRRLELVGHSADWRRCPGAQQRSHGSRR
jgi:hypothetical protein